MKKFLILCFLVVILLPLNAQNVFKPGTPAPALSVYKWINKTPEISDFSGKTIVLEFWATWCRPCIKAIPHINEMVDKFASDSVIFISISKEKPKVVQKFLSNKILKSYVGIDLNGKTNTNYKIKYVPKAYIIDSFGRIVWEGHPMSITDKLLTAIIKKEHIKKQSDNDK